MMDDGTYKYRIELRYLRAVDIFSELGGEVVIVLNYDVDGRVRAAGGRAAVLEKLVSKLRIE